MDAVRAVGFASRPPRTEAASPNRLQVIEAPRFQGVEANQASKAKRSDSANCLALFEPVKKFFSWIGNLIASAWAKIRGLRSEPQEALPEIDAEQAKQAVPEKFKELLKDGGDMQLKDLLEAFEMSLDEIKQELGITTPDLEQQFFDKLVEEGQSHIADLEAFQKDPDSVMNILLLPRIQESLQEQLSGASSEVVDILGKAGVKPEEFSVETIASARKAFPRIFFDQLEQSLLGNLRQNLTQEVKDIGQGIYKLTFINALANTADAMLEEKEQAAGLDQGGAQTSPPAGDGDGVVKADPTPAAAEPALNPFGITKGNRLDLVNALRGTKDPATLPGFAENQGLGLAYHLGKAILVGAKTEPGKIKGLLSDDGGQPVISDALITELAKEPAPHNAVQTLVRILREQGHQLVSKQP